MKPEWEWLNEKLEDQLIKTTKLADKAEALVKYKNGETGPFLRITAMEICEKINEGAGRIFGVPSEDGLGICLMTLKENEESFKKLFTDKNTRGMIEGLGKVKIEGKT